MDASTHSAPVSQKTLELEAEKRTSISDQKDPVSNKVGSKV